MVEKVTGLGEALTPLSECMWDDQSRETWEGPLMAMKASKE